MCRHDPCLTLGVEDGWTKIKDRSTLFGFSVCTSSGVRVRPPLIFFYGLSGTKHISLIQQAEFPFGPVQRMCETSNFLFGSDITLTHLYMI